MTEEHKDISDENDSLKDHAILYHLANELNKQAINNPSYQEYLNSLNLVPEYAMLNEAIQLNNISDNIINFNQEISVPLGLIPENEAVNQAIQLNNIASDNMINWYQDIHISSDDIPYNIERCEVAEYPNNQMNENVEKVIQLHSQQIELLSLQNAKLYEQNDHLQNNYNEIKKMKEIIEKELESEKIEGKKAKRYNIWMMIITIISVLIAIAAWLLPNILGGVF